MAHIVCAPVIDASRGISVSSAGSTANAFSSDDYFCVATFCRHSPRAYSGRCGGSLAGHCAYMANNSINMRMCLYCTCAVTRGVRHTYVAAPARANKPINLTGTSPASGARATPGASHNYRIWQNRQFMGPRGALCGKYHTCAVFGRITGYTAM